MLCAGRREHLASVSAGAFVRGIGIPSSVSLEFELPKLGNRHHHAHLQQRQALSASYPTNSRNVGCRNCCCVDQVIRPFDVIAGSAAHLGAGNKSEAAQGAL